MTDSAPHSRLFTVEPCAGRALAAGLQRISPAWGTVGSRSPRTDLGPVPGGGGAGAPGPAAPGTGSTVPAAP